MSRVKFVKRVVKAELRDPRVGFEQTVHRIEIRQDPLTGMRCRINVERAKRPHQLARTVMKADKLPGCPFCSPNLQKVTPEFPEKMPDRIKVGGSTVFPNLYPFGEFHAVAAFKDHSITLGRFTPKKIRNCLRASLQALELAANLRKGLKYWYINWNHLSPAGASIVHPHIQLLATAQPTHLLKKLLLDSRRYYHKHGRNYWDELVKVERRREERFIGKIGSVGWLASFAPLESKEVLAVVSGVSTLSDLPVEDFSDGLHRVLKGYERMGVESFNLSSYSAPQGQGNDFFRLHFRIIARPRLTPFYTSDSGFMERLQLEPVVDTFPETLAEEMQRFF